MFNPTPQQQNIIDHYSGHALVLAGPGSGKTVTLIAHVNKLILEKNVPSDDIWIMAFNRDISSKLGDKINNELTTNSPQATTIHTFILTQTLKYGTQLIGGFEIAESLGECGKDYLLWKPITKRLKEVHGIKKTSENKRFDVRHIKNYLWNMLRDFWLTSQEPDDKLFAKFNFEIERFKSIYKIVFLDELALKFLDTLKADPSFRRDVIKQRIIIDEFQDLNPTEHGILQQFSKEGVIFMVFGDDDQAVNDFRHAHADHIREFESIYKPTPYPLNRDRRCPKEILELSDKFIEGLPRFEKPSGYAPHKGKVDILNFDTDENEILGISNIVKKYLLLFPSSDNIQKPRILILSGTTGKVSGRSRITDIIDVLKSIITKDISGEKKEDPLDNDWGLAFKSLLSILVKDFSSMNLAALLSTIDPTSIKKINKYIEEEERKGNQVDFLNACNNIKSKVDNIEKLFLSINNLKNKIQEGDKFNPDSVVNYLPKNLNGKKEAEILINKVWDEIQYDNSINNKELNNHEKKSSKGYDFLQSLNKYITEDIKKPEIGTIHVTTYRKSKGLEADLVIVTSVDASDFYNDPQKRRLLYVSATRSKKNLILTYASNRSGARRFTRGRASKFKGIPRVYRSPLILRDYPTQEYSDEWLKNWIPI